MAVIFPCLENIQRLKVSPTLGEWRLLTYLKDSLDDSYEVFFNPYLDGDRPDIVILKEHCAAFIIEVKDWDLKNYSVTLANKWKVFDGSKYSAISSPQSQVFKYKKNLYSLHLPVVGLADLTNPNFYKLVHCFVYFHGSGSASINGLYLPAEQRQKEIQSGLNKAMRDNKIEFKKYDAESERVNRYQKSLQRDKGMSFGEDRLSALVEKIKGKSRHVLFDENVYRDFKRRLSPSEHTLKQGIPIKFDAKQLPLTNSEEGKSKIKGVSGCGKTSILCQRAINSYGRHKSTVLILTFNITLKNHIRDKISDIQGKRDFSSFEISNYHQFFNSQIINGNLDFDELVEEFGLEGLYFVDVFQDMDLPKYQTILVDEVQDYQSEWIKIIRNNFLQENGEMVLFGDESQNIYKTDAAKSLVVIQGFGRWSKLTRSYRTDLDSPLNGLFKEFQLKFLVEKYSDLEITDVSSSQMGMGFSLLRYEGVTTTGWAEAVFSLIKDYVRNYEMHPNDVVVLSSKVHLLRQLSELFIKEEKIHCMFETYEELASGICRDVDEVKKLSDKEINALVKENKKVIDDIRRTKKNHFYQNGGLVKLSTSHSYKGLESKNVFYILDGTDDPEVVYTSITRSSENLIIFDIGSKNQCSGFLMSAMSVRGG